MANSPHKIKFFIGTPLRWRGNAIIGYLRGGFCYSSVNMAGTADKVNLSVVYRMQENYMYF